MRKLRIAAKDEIFMKTIINIVISLLFYGCSAQSLIPKELKNVDLNKFVGNISTFERYALKENILQLVICKNESGSAGNAESDEVSENLYISNCEFGEVQICKLYVVERLIKISILKVYEDNANNYLEIEHGNYKQRKKSKIVLNKT